MHFIHLLLREHLFAICNRHLHFFLPVNHVIGTFILFGFKQAYSRVGPRFVVTQVTTLLTGSGCFLSLPNDVMNGGVVLLIMKAIVPGHRSPFKFVRRELPLVNRELIFQVLLQMLLVEHLL